MVFDVAVVGLGPVGATLANLLGALGLRCVVLEREAATYHLPRAVHFDDEVMRVFQSIGLADAMAAICHVSPGTKFVNGDGDLLVDWPRVAGIGPLGWHRSYRFHQPDLEGVLRAGVARFAGVDVRTRCEVLDITQDAGGAELAVVDHAGGTRERIVARYVVGCDGARSLVRRLIGTTMEELHPRQQWLVTDLILAQPKEALGDATIQHCNPARPATYVRGTGMRRRWEIMLMPGDDPDRATQDAQVWQWLAPWIAPHEATIERAAVYSFHAAIAREWRCGRLLLAGDAAHTTPPFLGQGMCAGIRDAANLAWKLARVVAGQSDAVLFDSYAAERREHVRDFIARAVEVGAMIQMTDAAAARERDERLAGRPVQMRSPEPRLGQHTDRAEPAGRLAPQPVLADGRRLDEALGAGFAVLVRPDCIAAWRARLPGICIVADPAVTPWLASLGTAGVVLRPDRYVLGVACDGDAAAVLLATM